MKGRFFLGGGDIREPRRDTLSRAYPATMFTFEQSNKRARTTEAEERIPPALASKESVQSLRDQMAKRKAEKLAVRRMLPETCEGDLQFTITSLPGGAITVLEALAVELPDVFAAEVLPKLELFDILNLAQVSKRYNDAVWNVAGVRSLEAKIEARLHSVGIVGCSNPMIWAAKHGNLPAIRAILQSGMDVNLWTYGSWKRTALFVAAEHDQVDAVKLLHEAGADPNIQREGRTALNWHVSVLRDEGNNPLLVRALIQARADVKIPDSTLNTPLHFTESEACALMLIDAGADINAVNMYGQSPLRCAIRFERPAVERLLRRFKARDIGP